MYVPQAGKHHTKFFADTLIRDALWGSVYNVWKGHFQKKDMWIIFFWHIRFFLFVSASNALSSTIPGRPETLDLDSNNLYKLMEEHDPEALQRMVEIADTLQGEQGGSNFLDVANSVSNYLCSITGFLLAAPSEERSNLTGRYGVCLLWLVGRLSVCGQLKKFSIFKILLSLKNSKTKMRFRPFWATFTFWNHSLAPPPPMNVIADLVWYIFRLSSSHSSSYIFTLHRHIISSHYLS